MSKWDAPFGLSRTRTILSRYQTKEWLDSIRDKSIIDRTGEKNPKTKLTQEQAQYILDHDEFTNGHLARMFGINKTHVKDIRKGRYWKSLRKKAVLCLLFLLIGSLRAEEYRFLSSKKIGFKLDTTGVVRNVEILANGETIIRIDQDGNVFVNGKWVAFEPKLKIFFSMPWIDPKKSQ